MRAADQHLSSDEIQQLAGSATQGVGSGLEDAMRHLDACEQCRLRMLLPEEHVAAGVEALAQRSRARTAACPPGSQWMELAAGIMPQKERLSHLEHAASCAHCGQLLMTAMEDVGIELTPEEESKVASLSSATPEWQDKMVGKITGISVSPVKAEEKPARKSGGFVFWPRWVFATAASILVAGAGWWAWILRNPSVETLLAQAYTERRTMEMRIPDAAHSEIHVQRGAGNSHAQHPQALLEAEAIISKKLTGSPQNADLLAARGRAELLEWDFENAITDLQHAVDAKPNSTGALTDLATAYSERAETEHRAVDYGTAMELLGKALAERPDDPIALYNRAITSERLFLFTQSIEDWQHYLRAEPTGPWSDEARRHLAEVQKKVNEKRSSLLKALFTTTQLASQNGSGDLWEELDSRIEEYMHAAVKEWLSQAFAQSARPQLSGQAQTALSALADVAWTRHRDSWLRDLLSGFHGVSSASAVLALAASVQANDNGDYSGGRRSAHEAGRLFRVAGNIPGQLRAEAEEVYSLHLLYDGPHCMVLVQGVRAQLEQHTYEWLRAHMSLEESNCAGLLGNLGQARAAIVRGTREAGDHHYASVFLRGIGFQADSAASLGDTQQGFSLASKGLELFWSSKLDLMKGYNLYTDLDTAADVLRLPHLQVALWQQATALIDLHPDLVQRAMAHRWYGNSAYLAGIPDLAEREFAQASALFKQAPSTEATRRGQMDAEIWLAGLEARQGDFDQSAARLQQVQQNLKRAPSFGPEIGFYSAQSELSMRRRDLAAAGDALRSAIFIAEWALRSFPSENERNQWAGQTERAYRNLVAWKFQAGEASDALEFWEWYKGAGFRAVENETPWPSSGLDSAIPPDVSNAPPLRAPTVVANQLPLLHEKTVIAYAELTDGIAVWAYDDRGIFSRWIAKSPVELENMAFQFRHLCSTSDSNLDSVRSAARALYDVLIAPIEEKLLAGRTLVFEPDGALNTIPMVALLDRQGRYLNERAAVVVNSGLYQALRAHSAVEITAETPALVVSVPAPGDGFVPLPDADAEARSVAQNFRSPRPLQGPTATLAAIQRELPGARVFHFVGHAVALPEMNGLLLAERDPRTQRPRMVNAESLKPESVQDLQLAVLAACDTANEGFARYSGTEGLAQALLRAGVPHVVASRWRVDSATTVRFMTGFYGRLLARNRVASSLRDTQLAVASQPPTAHPYHWAAFGVQDLQLASSEE